MSDWERIESVVEWANMTTNSFAHHIGLARGENLYQIKRGNYGISQKIADMIIASFPSISKLWLLTGEGSMFAPVRPADATMPLYDICIEDSIRCVTSLVPTTYLAFPTKFECDFAMRYKGTVMGSVTPAGSIILLKKISVDKIISGNECVVVTKKNVFLRIVKVDVASGDEHRFMLVPAVADACDTVYVETHEIEVVYLVKGKIIFNS